MSVKVGVANMNVPDVMCKSIMACAVLAVCVLLLPGCTASPGTFQNPEGSQSGLDLASIPLEQALSSGRPSLAEFGRGTCVPCKAMKPILEELARDYDGKLNVVIVEIDRYRDLTSQYRIMAIPTQIFFDSGGREVTRHIGFLPEEEIIAQLKRMGLE
jgi:thioredoxin 1